MRAQENECVDVSRLGAAPLFQGNIVYNTPGQQKFFGSYDLGIPSPANFYLTCTTGSEMQFLFSTLRALACSE